MLIVLFIKFYKESVPRKAIGDSKNIYPTLGFFRRPFGPLPSTSLKQSRLIFAKFRLVHLDSSFKFPLWTWGLLNGQPGP